MSVRHGGAYADDIVGAYPDTCLQGLASLGIMRVVACAELNLSRAQNREGLGRDRQGTGQLAGPDIHIM